MLAKGDVLARAHELRLPQWMKDFLQMVRQWLSAGKALLDLGLGLHELERRSKAGQLDGVRVDFVEAVHALSNNMERYWVEDGMALGEERVSEMMGGGWGEL